MQKNNQLSAHTSIVVFAWNGTNPPFEFIKWDAAPNFDVLLFNYTGNGVEPALVPPVKIDYLLNIQTEFKGSLLNQAQIYLQNNNQYIYIGFMDDDLQISIADINELIRIASSHQLDAFQPATTAQSYNSHSFTNQKKNTEIEYVNWIEIMCPFYRKEIFDAAKPFYANNISSYGIDCYAIPFYQKILGKDKTAIIHTVGVTHLKPVTHGSKIFSNGLSARQEAEIIRKEILHQIKKNHSAIFSKKFLKEVYEYRTIRYEKLKRDFKALVGFKKV